LNITTSGIKITTYIQFTNTNISSKGKSVVDYVLTLHEQICDFVDFRVHTMSDVVTCLDLLRYESVPDHSLLKWIIGSQTDVANVDEKPDEKKRIRAPRKFRMEGSLLCKNLRILKVDFQLSKYNIDVMEK
jgi:hypothetical protein